MFYVSYIESDGRQTKKLPIKFDDLEKAKRALTNKDNLGKTIAILDEEGFPIAIMEYRHKQWQSWKHYK